RSCRLWGRGLALQEWGNRLGFAGNGPGRRLSKGWQDRQQRETDRGKDCGEFHSFHFWQRLFTAHARVGYSVGDIGKQIHSHISETYSENTTLHQGIVTVGDSG